MITMRPQLYSKHQYIHKESSVSIQSNRMDAQLYALYISQLDTLHIHQGILIPYICMRKYEIGI